MKLLLWFVGFFALIQLIRPDFNNPKVDENATLKTSPEVMTVLKGACYDCHSNETIYPWYKNVAPVSWVMADHINSGRKALNFSDWSNIDPAKKLERLKRAKHLVEINQMPDNEYQIMHQSANLTTQQKTLINNFFESEIQTLENSQKAVASK
jgi:hypothetical protein